MNNFSQNRDALLVAIGIGILLIMVVPMPPMLMDFLIAGSFSLALLVMLVTFYVREPVEFSVFPMVLLGTTLFRLSLNVASTRLILLNGGNGDFEAGRIIETFGRIVVGDNVVVGIVVFSILVTINFVVITKGAGRIAEVAARFTLDALPGKQMAIDAELNAGIIDEGAAKSRRLDIAREADFYGAMDGASKFIRGDAIAGILITLINIIGGILIGVVQHGMPFENALQTYTVLTIGDGLVGQLPALVISGAAGLLVTRVPSKDGDENSELHNLLASQLFSKTRPLIYLCISLTVFSMIPGLRLPFLALAALTAGIVFSKTQEDKMAKEQARIEEIENNEVQMRERDIPLESILTVEPLALELGMDLVSLVDESKGGNLIRSIQRIRSQLAEELGLMIPPVHVRDNLNIDGGKYRILLRGEFVAEFDVIPRQVLAINPGDAKAKLRGVRTVEPSFGLDAWWIPEHQRIRAQSLGYTVVNNSVVVSTHLTEVLRQFAHEIFSQAQFSEYLQRISDRSPQLVDELIPTQITRQGVFQVLRNLLKEGISIRDSQTILEAIADYAHKVKEANVLTEFVRQRLSRHITRRFTGDDGSLDVIEFSPDVQAAFDRARTIKENGEININLAPDLQKTVLRGVQSAAEQFPSARILSPNLIRGNLHRLCARHMERTPVFLSSWELEREVRFNRVAMVTMKGIKLL